MTKLNLSYIPGIFLLLVNLYRSVGFPVNHFLIFERKSDFSCLKLHKKTTKTATDIRQLEKPMFKCSAFLKEIKTVSCENCTAWIVRLN